MNLIPDIYLVGKDVTGMHIDPELAPNSHLK
jgi:hypothetical protein